MKWYITSDAVAIIEFPPELSLDVRAALHEQAELMGLAHWSEGHGKARHLLMAHDNTTVP